MSLTSPAASDGLAARAVKVTKIYGEGDAAVRALDSVTVGFPMGNFTAIMGPSGSGKSTLMHCVAGLDDVTSGQAFLGATEVTSLNDKDLTLLRRAHGRVHPQHLPPPLGRRARPDHRDGDPRPGGGRLRRRRRVPGRRAHR